MRQQSGTGVHSTVWQASNGIQKTTIARIMSTNQQINNIKRQDPKSRKVKENSGQCLIGSKVHSTFATDNCLSQSPT